MSAAVALVPTPASATPDASPVEASASYYGGLEVVLPDGRLVQAALNEYRYPSTDGWTAELNFTVWSETCEDESFCQADMLTGSAPLDADQVQFDRALRTASVHDVEITVSGVIYPDWDPGDGGEGDPGGEDPWAGGEDPNAGYEDPNAGYEDPNAGYEEPNAGYEEPGTGWEDPGAGFGEPVSETFVVSLEFTGTGTVTHSTYHGPMCGDGERQCISNRREASRTATGTLTLDGAAPVTGEGLLMYLQGLDIPRPAAWSGHVE